MVALLSMEWLASSSRLRIWCKWYQCVVENIKKDYLCLASHVKFGTLCLPGPDTDICWGKLHLKFALFFYGHNYLRINKIFQRFIISLYLISPFPQQISEASLQRLAWRWLAQCCLRPSRSSYNNFFPAFFGLCCCHLSWWDSRARPAWAKHCGCNHKNFPGSSRPLLERKTRKWVRLRS